MKAPDKGSFPLDHFKECDKFAVQYDQCLQKHQLLPKKCRKVQKQYLECRMEQGLMDKEDMQKLGFTEQASWDNEDQEKKFLFDKIQNLKQKARDDLKKRYEYRQQMANQTNVEKTDDK